MLEMIASGDAMLEATPVQFGVWMACAFIAIKGWNEFQITLGKHKLPQPVQVEGTVKYATAPELAKLELRVEQLQRETRDELSRLNRTLTENYNALMKSSAEGRSRVHGQINDISKSINRMEGVLETLAEHQAANQDLVKQVNHLKGVVDTITKQ